jgi:nitrite reductase/ring-hydroxylating ferredoxin subunit
MSVPAGDDAGWTRVAALADFGPDRKLARRVCELDLLLVRVGDGVVAVRNQCTHLGHALDRGRVMAGTITCPFHGACFDLRTGAARSGPAVAALACYEARVHEGQVDVRLHPPTG